MTRVEEINKEVIQLELPIRQSGSSMLSKGDVVDVTYNRKDSAYLFKASILDLFDGPNHSMKVKKLSNTERIQRRKNVRLDISGKMKYRILGHQSENGPALGSEKTGTLLNISAGGVLFEGDHKIKSEAILLMSFSLKESDRLDNVLAVVKRCEGTREDGYIIGAEFITKANLNDYGLDRLSEFLPQGTGTFDESLQKIVVQFIYDEQVKLRKKGLLA
jgi:c-di-GMP-binding flagellar brake protein YcgR